MRAEVEEVGDYEEELRRCVDSAVRFGRRFLGDKYTSDQVRYLGAVSLVAGDGGGMVLGPGGHATGKTHADSTVVIWWLMMRGPVVMYGPTYRQLKEELWREVRKKAGRAIEAGVLRAPRPSLDCRWELDEGRWCLGMSSDKGEKITGHHGENLLLLVHEANGVTLGEWDALDTYQAPMTVASGNPVDAPGGGFYKLSEEPWTTVISFSCLRHPNVTTGRVVVPGAVSKRWVDRKRESWGIGHYLWNTKLDGTWDEGGSDESLVIPLESVLRAEAREVEGGYPLVVSCDPAGGGENEGVTVAFRGRQQLQVKRVFGKGEGNAMTSYRDAVEVAEAIGGERAKSRVVIVVDADGLGAGVFSRLEDEGWDVVEFHGGTKPILEAEVLSVNPFDKRTEAWWVVRDALATDAWSLVSDDDQRGQLCAPRWFDDRKDGKIRLEKKDEMEKRGIASPDHGDAVAMGMWTAVRRGAAIGGPGGAVKMAPSVPVVGERRRVFAQMEMPEASDTPSRGFANMELPFFS